jgi:hypothetical protein
MVSYNTLMHMNATQILILVVVAIAVLVPAVIILRRLGFSPWWAVLAPLSPLNIIGLWVLAFKKWPIEDVPQHPLQ